MLRVSQLGKVSKACIQIHFITAEEPALSFTNFRSVENIDNVLQGYKNWP